MYPGSRKHQDPTPEARKARAQAKAECIQVALDDYRQYLDIPTSTEDPDVLKVEEQKFRDKFSEDVVNFHGRHSKYNRMVVKDDLDPQLEGIINSAGSLATRAINAGASNVKPIFTLDHVNNLQEAPEESQKQVS